MRPEHRNKAMTETRECKAETETKNYETETSMVNSIAHKVKQIGMLYHILHI